MQEPTEPRGKRRSFARVLRGWTGRPLALALGWAMSCALVTAVTLTAVNRVGHEVAGSSPRVISQAGASAQASEQSASAASLSASADAAASPTQSPVSSAPQDIRPAQSQTTPRPSQNPTPTSFASIAPSISASPSSSASPSTSPTAPTSASPSTPPTSSPASPSPSASISQSGTPFYVPKDSPSPYGFIKIVCSGNSITGTVKLLDSAYSVTTKSLSDPRVDIVFSNGTQSTEYVYTCNNGSPFGGQVIPERP